MQYGTYAVAPRTAYDAVYIKRKSHPWGQVGSRIRH